MRFIDFFWFLLDGDRSSKQLVAEKNISKTATYKENTMAEQVPAPVEEAIEQPLQAQYTEQYEVFEDFCGDCDHDFFE